MRVLLTGVLFFMLFSVSAAGNKINPKETSEINSLFTRQVEAWNEGNLEKFMQTYWNSEKLSFVGSRGPTYGWQATLESYKKGYPDKAAMGNLKFTILDVSKIDRKTVYVIGKFQVTREKGNLSGHFTVVIQKIKNEWLIVSDHSSSSN